MPTPCPAGRCYLLPSNSASTIATRAFTGDKPSALGSVLAAVGRIRPFVQRVARTTDTPAARARTNAASSAWCTVPLPVVATTSPRTGGVGSGGGSNNASTTAPLAPAWDTTISTRGQGEPFTIKSIAFCANPAVAGFTQRSLGGRCDGRHHRVVQVGGQHRHQAAFTVAQRAAQLVGVVTHGLDRLLHPRQRFGRCAAGFAVHDTRHGGDRHTGLGRNFPQ